MQWGEKGPAPGPKLRLRRERAPNTMRYGERTQQRLVPLASLRSARVPSGV